MEIIKIIISFLSSMLQFATPIILAGLGGVICENAGVVNIALEGMMRMGGFFAVLGSYITSTRFDQFLAVESSRWKSLDWNSSCNYNWNFSWPSSWIYIYIIKRKPDCFRSSNKCICSWWYDLLS